MKKFFTFVLAVVIVMSLCVTALADNVQSFVLNNVQAYSTAALDVTYSNTSVYKPTASSTNAYVEVKHTVTSTSVKYTNLYHIVKRSVGKMVQQKWLTPGNDYVPLSSTTSITAGQYYGVAARGNTDYSEQSGIRNINMEGYMRAH